LQAVEPGTAVQAELAVTFGGRRLPDDRPIRVAGADDAAKLQWRLLERACRRDDCRQGSDREQHTCHWPAPGPYRAAQPPA